MRYLVRHGDAGNKREWTGPDLARPLSLRGRFEANALVDLLAAFSIDRILSSAALRCRQTVEPLAGKRGMAVLSHPLLAVDADPDRAVELLVAGDGDVVLCTHGELIRPAAVEAPRPRRAHQRGRGLAQGLRLGAGGRPREDQQRDLPAAARGPLSGKRQMSSRSARQTRSPSTSALVGSSPARTATRVDAS